VKLDCSLNKPTFVPGILSSEIATGLGAYYATAWLEKVASASKTSLHDLIAAKSTRDSNIANTD